MKLIQATLILFVSSCAVAQAAPTKDTKPAEPKPAAVATQPKDAAPKHDDAAKAAISADAAVITVPNICASSQKDCKTTVTRKQFENTLLGVSGGEMVPPDMPKRFANQYGEMLVFAKEAEKQGLDKEAATDAALHFARVQVLAQRYLRVLQQKAKPTEMEIQNYYDKNKTLFQGVMLDRLMIPTGHAKSKKPEELKALAEDMKKRLAAGEDADKLEQEIYTTLNLTGPPRTSVTLRHEDTDQENLLELADGAVTDVTTEPMALLVYKSHGKKPLPLEMVKSQVSEKVYQEKLQAAADALLNGHKPVLNDAYFPTEKPKASHMH